MCFWDSFPHVEGEHGVMCCIMAAHTLEKMIWSIRWAYEAFLCQGKMGLMF